MMGLKGPDMIEAEAFFENTDDIINEEEYEESIINQSIRKNDEIITKPPIINRSVEKLRQNNPTPVQKPKTPVD